MQPISSLASKAASIDLEPIIYKLVCPEEFNWSVEKADETAELYRKFLVLCGLYPNKSIVPTQDIDKFWHTHILDTQKYRTDCDSVFGYFLDHFPYFGLQGKEDKEVASKAFKETKELFRKHFGIHLNESCHSVCDDLVSPARTRPRLKREMVHLSV